MTCILYSQHLGGGGRNLRPARMIWKPFLKKESYFKTSKQNKNRTKHQPTDLETSVYPEHRCEISIMRLSNRIQLYMKHDGAGILVFFVALIGHWWKATWVRKGFNFHVSPSLREAMAGTWRQELGRDGGGTLLTGLFPGPHQWTLSIQPRPTCPNQPR